MQKRSSRRPIDSTNQTVGRRRSPNREGLVELQPEQLKQVAGGVTLEGPHGGWGNLTESSNGGWSESLVVDGPHGGW